MIGKLLPSKMFSRMDRSVFGRWWWTVDRGLLAAFLTLIVSGVVLVAAASPPVAERIGVSHYHFIIRHMVFLVPSLALFFGMSLASPKMVWRICSVAFIGTIVAMILVLLIGPEIKGAHRWISLGSFSLQPSEFIKPCFAIMAAWLIAKQKETPEFPGIKIMLGLFALVVALLIMQPDFGMTFVMCTIFGAQIFLAGFPLWIIGILGVIGVVGSYIAYLTISHVRSRIDRFLDPESGDTYQVEKALEAFQNGGIFGTGPGQGTVKLSLPDGHADFIFAVAGEEFGLMFVSLLVLLFAYILLRGFNRIMTHGDVFALLATSGLLTMFGIQALVHMGSSVNLLPTKGMTLPFISYGGSSLLSMGFSMGMVLALTRSQVRSSIAKGGKIMRKSNVTEGSQVS